MWTTPDLLLRPATLDYSSPTYGHWQVTGNIWHPSNGVDKKQAKKVAVVHDKKGMRKAKLYTKMFNNNQMLVVNLFNKWFLIKFIDASIF